MRRKEVFNVCFASIMVSFAIVVELLFKYVIVLKMPNGGGIHITMLPLVVVSIVCNWKYGLISGLTFGLLDCFVIDGYTFSPYSFIFDYVLAYSSVFIAGFFKKPILNNKKIYFILAFFLVYFLKYLLNSFSGVLNASIWGYDDEFLISVFGEGKSSRLYLYIYSFLIYNLPYLGVSFLLSVNIGLICYKHIFLKFNTNDLKN